MLTPKHVRGSNTLKRILKGSLGILGLAIILGVIFVFYTHSRLDSYLHDLEALKAQAVKDASLASEALATSEFDTRLTMRRSFLEKIFAELRGAENRTRFGDKLMIRDAQLTMESGFVRLDVNADLHARMGLYQGSVKAVYYGFVTFVDSGCQISLRTASVHPEKNPLVFKTLFEAWLVLRMQDRLKIPDITLPLSLDHRLQVEESSHLIKEEQVELLIPGRAIDMEIGDPSVLVTPESISVLAGRIQVNGEKKTPVHSETIQQTTGDLELGLQMDLIRNILNGVIAPDRDVLIKSDHMPEVWRKEDKILGISVTNRADLRHVKGFLDLKQASLVRTGTGWDISIRAEGEVRGQVQGKAYGIKLDLPFKATPRLDERIPIEIKMTQDGLEIDFHDKPVMLDLYIET